MKPEERDRDETRPEDETPRARKSGDDAASGSGRDKRPDPTRYGDWEKNGRCIDF